jgi:hypothetical protein
MTPAERVVVEAAVRLVEINPYNIITSDLTAMNLSDAVDALLAERAGPQPETVEITWAQVVEGDQIYRAKNGGPIEPGNAAGQWFTVTDRGGLMPGTDRIRLHARGIPKPIQPVASRLVIVKRGATGKAVDMLGSVVWSGANVPVDIAGRHNPAPAPDIANDPEASEES